MSWIPNSYLSQRTITLAIHPYNLNYYIFSAISTAEYRFTCLSRVFLPLFVVFLLEFDSTPCVSNVHYHLNKKDLNQINQINKRRERVVPLVLPLLVYHNDKSYSVLPCHFDPISSADLLGLFDDDAEGVVVLDCIDLVGDDDVVDDDDDDDDVGSFDSSS